MKGNDGGCHEFSPHAFNSAVKIMPDSGSDWVTAVGPAR
jgi:hypothetical protein